VQPIGGDLFDLISSRAGWLARRHAVISGNIANADTPGFTPLDVKPQRPERLARPAAPAGLGMARTAGGHLAGTPPRPVAGERGSRSEGWETAPSGNAVVIEEQVQKLAQTQLDHQLATSLYGKYVGMLRIALGVGAA
jgi:flagellar basal-body rod protein FlgB